MKTPCLLCLAAVMVLCAPFIHAADPEPLKLIQSFKMPVDVKGHFDHVTVDVKGHRLFTTPEDYKAVIVLDDQTGKIIHIIRGIERPHAVLYREDLSRLYVTDGGAGELKIFDATTYQPVKSVKLLADADSIGYDPATGYLYVDNGGGDAGQTYSMFSVIDTTRGEKVADLRIDGDTLEAIALETSGPRIYVNNRAKSEVSVVDRQARSLIESWPVTMGKVNVAMALDETNHRLFVACRSGQIVVFDTQTGKGLQALPITKGVDDLTYDPASKRIYAACDGAVDVYEQSDPDHYKSLGKVPTEPAAKTARLVPELHRYFVAAPQRGSTPAEILVFEVQ
jgi:DNA-binding beta-propeller fold protein YncE